MKEKKIKKLYNSLTNVKEDYIEEAQNANAKKQHPVWMKWGVLAACLLLGFIIGFAVPRIVKSISEKSQHEDAGIADTILNGDPNEYITAQGTKTTDDTEIAEQDQTAQTQGDENPDQDEAVSSETETVIASYGSDGSSACYKAPDNGTCNYSIPLRNAMEEYGDTVLYKVVLDVFSSNNLLEADSEAVKYEVERLTELNYTVDLEHYNDGSMDHDYLVLFITQAQLTEFAGNDSYGYMFWLYEERAK